ncbi:MAG: hypothetical protein FJ315_01605, partial [SAR202 cluster bacterium]|nr:hypothetical protein [SAR202 cluster bacterium]
MPLRLLSAALLVAAVVALALVWQPPVAADGGGIGPGEPVVPGCDAPPCEPAAPEGPVRTSAALPITDRNAVPLPVTNVEFSEAGLSPFSGIVVTNQFASLGVTFSNSGFVFTPQTGFPGVSDQSNLGNFGGSGVACPGPRSIFFASMVTAVGFNIVTNGPDSARLTARRNSLDVGSFTFNTHLNAVFFIGMADPGGFNELVLEIVPDSGSGGSNRCMLLDRLVFTSAPSNQPPTANAGGPYTVPEGGSSSSTDPATTRT